MNKEKKERLSFAYILYQMQTKGYVPQLTLSEKETMIEPLLVGMLAEDLIKIVDDSYYEMTEKGTETAERLLLRQAEFRQMFEIFAYVDLTKGEFAYSKVYDMSEEAWTAYTNDERWEDLRLAVMDYKKMDIDEALFLYMLDLDQLQKDDWYWELILGTVWNEVEEMKSGLLKWQSLGDTEEESRDTIEDIITQGCSIAVDLLNRAEEECEEEVIEDDGDGSDEEYYEDPGEYDPPYYEHYYREPVYYQPYVVDPLFVSAVFVTALII